LPEKQTTLIGCSDLRGKDAFLLHDTYGLPIEVTIEVAAARGVSVDVEEFLRLMEIQQKKSRKVKK
jgi:alanyl-tRNA synthetase